MYDREGNIAGVNNQFRELTGITEDEIKNGTTSVFDYLRKENTKIPEFMLDAFGGQLRACRGIGECITVKEEKRKTYHPKKYYFAIFFPMSYDDDIPLAGIMIDENDADND